MQDRDLKILEFLNKVRVATREQVQGLIFENVHQNVSMRRLKYLVDNDYLKRSYFNLDGHKNVYVYYMDRKPSKRLIKHDLIITDFAIRLMKEGYNIIEFEKSIVIGPVIPDAYIKIEKDNKYKSLLLEVQLSKHDCLKKYYNFKKTVLEYTNWDSMPRLFIITNNKLEKTKLQDIKVLVYDLNMAKLGDLI